MEKQFDILLKNRIIFKRFLDQTPKEDLFRIPNGFKNNIWWNIAHTMVTQQLLIYKLSRVGFGIEEELIEKYRKGTVPQVEPSESEFRKVSEYLVSTVEQLQKDYSEDLFTNFESYMTTPKVGLDTVEDAIAFLTFHDGIHLGAILAIQKALRV
ncbi:DinB family protein [Flagellimonas algicola]|uniref:DinB family protein n=1 Tax=Flagellimonas algicola TaxID=2583815 RepID=A0ABY2WKD3_9FLAO|nr:DinB family protein [Allomuricauda algicola]TMU55299.1 DinB family protein [Allomuricauda algicola]